MRTIYQNWVLDRMVDLFGECPMEALVAAHGGTPVTVPAKPTAYWRDLLGDDVAEWLCKERGDTPFSVPSRKAMNKRRSVAAQRLEIQTSTKPTTELAKQFGISTRRVRAIKAERRDPRLT